MASFDLEGFLNDPSLDRLDACRKVDLFAIASHFDFSFPKTIAKERLKELVMCMLVEKHVLGKGEAATAVPVSLETQQDVTPELKPLLPYLDLTHFPLLCRTLDQVLIHALNYA